MYIKYKETMVFFVAAALFGIMPLIKKETFGVDVLQIIGGLSVWGLLLCGILLKINKDIQDVKLQLAQLSEKTTEAEIKPE